MGSEYRSILRMVLPSAVLLFAGCGVAALFLISATLGIAAFGFCALTGVIAYERRERERGQTALDFKIKKLGDKHNTVARALADEQSKIAEIKATLRRNVDKQPAKNQLVKPPTPQTFQEAIKAEPPKPRAIVPTKFETANDRQISDGQTLSDMVVRELLAHALEHKRIDAFLQPIQRLPQRQTRFYEIFARVRAKPGVYIPAGRYQEMAEQNKQMKDIDTILLQEVLGLIKQTANLTQMPPFFINVGPASLGNKSFMGQLVAFLGQNRGLSSRIVLEIKQTDYSDMPIPVLQIMSGLGRLGVRFSIDHAENLGMDIEDLHRFNVKFIKAPASLFMDKSNNPQTLQQILRQKRILEGNGIGVIAEKIENEEMMRSLLDFDLHYGQGFLFGRPDLQGVYEPKLMRKRA